MKIGALWLKEDGGKKYFSGTLELPFLGKENIKIVRNTQKKSEKAPDYLVLMEYVSTGRQAGAGRQGGRNGTAYPARN